MLKLRRVLEFYQKNKLGNSDHIVYKNGNRPLDYRPECWCEARIVICRNLTLFGRTYKGYSRIILHDGKWHKPIVSPTNKVDELIRTLAEPPEGGWDRKMDEESVNEFLESISKHEYKERKIVQRKNETVQDYYQRVKAAINSGITEIRYETNDPELFAELLERDDDFETEIDEEE